MYLNIGLVALSSIVYVYVNKFMWSMDSYLVNRNTILSYYKFPSLI